MNSKVKLENKIRIKKLDVKHKQLNKLLNLKLDEINGLISQMYTAQAVLHDIATPLTILTNQISKENIDKDILISNINDISKLVNEYKTKEHSITKYETLNLKNILSQCIKISEKTYTNLDITLNCTNNISINISSVKLRQIILNLISNSAQQKVLNAQIKITAFNTPKNIKIIYKDTAGGIPKGIYKEIFKPFYTNKSSKTNSGIGLYICKQIIEKEYLGSIKCITKLGKGTIFYIKFPRNVLKNRV